MMARGVFGDVFVILFHGSNKNKSADDDDDDDDAVVY